MIQEPVKGRPGALADDDELGYTRAPLGGPLATAESGTRPKVDTANIAVAVILICAFTARLLRSNEQSYWLDELLSVSKYGVEHPSALDMVRHLARESVHPPLYQLILFYWMKLFGHTEVATRSLSNLYVTGAGLCLYLVARKAMGPRRALMATLYFELMNVPFYYAMETRSYGQSLLLSTLSSLALFALMRVLARQPTWREIVTSGAGIGLVLANVGLLMTHYYNALFLGMQGVFLLVWSGLRGLRLRRAPRDIVVDVAKLAALLVAPLALQLALWAPIMLQSYARQSQKYPVRATILGPLRSFFLFVVKPNLGLLPRALLLVCACLIVWHLGAQAFAALRNRRVPRTGRAVLGAYAAAVSVGPFMLAYVLFSLAGRQLYVARYFSFTAPAIAILLVPAVEQAVILLATLGPRLRLWRLYLRASAVVALLGVLLVAPGTRAAVLQRKPDQRGIAQQVVRVVSADPHHKYVVFATNFAAGPSSDYYFKRLGGGVRVHADLKGSVEKRPGTVFDADRATIDEADYVIVVFALLKASKFRKTLATLAKRYRIEDSLLYRGRGHIVYDVKQRALPAARHHSPRRHRH